MGTRIRKLVPERASVFFSEDKASIKFRGKASVDSYDYVVESTTGRAYYKPGHRVADEALEQALCEFAESRRQKFFLSIMQVRRTLGGADIAQVVSGGIKRNVVAQISIINNKLEVVLLGEDGSCLARMEMYLPLNRAEKSFGLEQGR